MNKEEILKKSREENKNKQDEMERSIAKDGAMVGRITVGIISLLFYILQWIAEKEPSFGILCFPFACSAASYWVQWVNKRGKTNLFCACASSFAALAGVAIYILNLFAR